MRTPPPSKEPCPDKTINETGAGFALGLLWGTAYHSFLGAKNSTRGHKLSGAIQTLRLNAPKTAARFGMWGALFGTLDCGMRYFRHKEDPLNSITSAAVTCGLFEVRRGVWPVARSAAAGAGLVAFYEGILVSGDRLMSLSKMRKETTVNYPHFPPSRDGAAAGADEIGFDLLFGEGGTRVQF